MSLSWQLGLYLFLTPVLALSTFSQSLTQSCKAALPTETTASAHNDLQSGTRAQIRNSVSREKLDQHPLKFLKLEPRLDWDVDVFQGFPDYITCDVRKEGKQPRVFKDQLILAMRFGIESGPANVYESYLMPEVNFVWSRESVRQKPDTHGDNPKEISYNVISFKYVSHQSPIKCTPFWDGDAVLPRPPGLADPNKKLRFILNDSKDIYERFPDHIVCCNMAPLPFSFKQHLLAGMPSPFGETDVFESYFFEEVHFVWRRTANQGDENPVYEFLFLRLRNDFTNCYPTWKEPRHDE